MAEVASQLKPLSDQLTTMHEWQLGFWSNGSGKIPGFFQMRMKEDDERNARIKTDLEKQTEITRRMAEYLEKEKTLREERDKQLAFWMPKLKWAAGLIGSAIVTLSLWIGPKVVRAGTILIEDYMEHHPAVTNKLKNVGEKDVPSYTSDKKPNDVSGGGTPHF